MTGECVYCHSLLSTSGLCYQSGCPGSRPTAVCEESLHDKSEGLEKEKWAAALETKGLRCPQCNGLLERSDRGAWYYCPSCCAALEDSAGNSDPLRSREALGDRPAESTHEWRPREGLKGGSCDYHECEKCHIRRITYPNGVHVYDHRCGHNKPEPPCTTPTHEEGLGQCPDCPCDAHAPGRISADCECHCHDIRTPMPRFQSEPAHECPACRAVGYVQGVGPDGEPDGEPCPNCTCSDCTDGCAGCAALMVGLQAAIKHIPHSCTGMTIEGSWRNCARCGFEEILERAALKTNAPVKSQRFPKSPGRSLCPDCKGSGRGYNYTADTHPPCGGCDGSGTVPIKTQPCECVSRGASKARATALHEKYLCEICNGSGTVPVGRGDEDGE